VDEREQVTVAVKADVDELVGRLVARGLFLEEAEYHHVLPNRRLSQLRRGGAGGFVPPASSYVATPPAGTPVSMLICRLSKPVPSRSLGARMISPFSTRSRTGSASAASAR